MQDLQTVLDYAAIAPIIITIGLFVEYVWRRSAATPGHPTQATLAVSAKQHAPNPPATASEPLHIPDPVTLAEIALADELIQVCQAAADISDLLAIPASLQPVEIPESALPTLGKLYSVPGSGKWSSKRKLRNGERAAVLAAIAA